MAEENMTVKVEKILRIDSANLSLRVHTEAMSVFVHNVFKVPFSSPLTVSKAQLENMRDTLNVVLHLMEGAEADKAAGEPQ